jgi:hypothetical protein
LHGAICVVSFSAVILIVIANRSVMPWLDELVSARPVAIGVIGGYPTKPDKVAIFHLPRAYAYGLDYYFQKELPEWTPENTSAVLVFSSKQGLPQLNQYPQLDNLTSNRLYTPVTPDLSIFMVDLRLREPPGK